MNIKAVVRKHEHYDETYAVLHCVYLSFSC